MAELAFGLFGSLFGAGATTAASAATTAFGSWAAGTTITTAAGVTTPLLSAGLGSTALSVLQGVAVAGSALATLGAGASAAQDAKLQASATALEARNTALKIREEELEKIGQARVGFAASGVDLSSSAAIENRIGADSAYERELTRTTGRISSGQIKLRGKNAMLGAAASAGGTAANYIIDLARRG